MTIAYEDAWLTVHHGDWTEVLATLPDESVNCVVTSPPYWGLRDYGVPGQIGLEPTPEEYVERLVAGFRDVRRVLRRDGTLWLNLGDSYASGAGKVGERPGGGERGDRWAGLPGSRGHRGQHLPHQSGKAAPRISAMGPMTQPNRMPIAGLKAKDRVMIPARVALALQADGWWLRDEIVWAKPNPMPSSVEDRTTPAHEMVYLLTRSARYTYDADAIREAAESGPSDLRKMAEGRERIGGRVLVLDDPKMAASGLTNVGRKRSVGGAPLRSRKVGGRDDGFTQMPGGEAEWAENGRPGRNKRSVWTVATSPYPEAHFATFPPKLIEPMILAGCPRGGVVLDPFGGSGTVALVAEALGRRAVLIELNEAYIAQALERVAQGRRDGSGPALDMALPAPDDSLWATEAVS